MTVNQLMLTLKKLEIEDGAREIEVWLPGSTIRLEFNKGIVMRRDGKLLIEGNINPGSALAL